MSVSEAAVNDTTGVRLQPGALLWILLALFVIGTVSFLVALFADGGEIDYALFTVNWMYLMGISQAGVVFCAIMRLVRAQWSKPYYRVAELSTLAFAPFAFLGLLVLYFGGRHEMFYWLSAGPDAHISPWLDSGWLLVRNLFALLLFYGLATKYFLDGYRVEQARRSGTAQIDPRAAERRLYLFSPWVIIGFVLCNTFVAWDFGMMLIEHWHSTVFPIYYWFGNLFAGTAALLAFPVLLGRAGVGAAYFGHTQTRNLGMVLTGFTLMWLYFYWAQFFVIWFGNMPHEAGPVWRQMYGHYGPYYWTMMFGCFFVPFATFIFAISRRNVLVLSLLAISINIGVWMSKFLIVVPALAERDVPFDQLTDVTIAVGLAAGFLATLVWLLGRIPLFARWEMQVLPERRR